MNSYTYAFQAALYCPDCARDIMKRLRAEGRKPSSDSDDWPLRSSVPGGGEADSPQHCDCGAECLNAIELTDGHKIGAWLENELTAYGAEYVREAVQAGGEVAELWEQWYSDYL